MVNKGLTLGRAHGMMSLMVKKASSDLDFFYMQCGNWDGVSTALSPREACKKAILNARRELKGEFRMSPLIIAMNLKEEMENDQNSISAFQVDALFK